VLLRAVGVVVEADVGPEGIQVLLPKARSFEEGTHGTLLQFSIVLRYEVMQSANHPARMGGPRRVGRESL
jgi:hypothetical protein